MSNYGWGRPDDPGYDPMPGEDIRPFPRVDLAALAKNGIPEPELLCDRLLYRGGLHSLGSPPDAGKGTLFCYWTVTLLAAGHKVVLIDEEGGQEVVTEKLLALGATPEQLERLWYVEFPSRQWDEPDWKGLWALLGDWQPALVGYDSCGALLATAGKDENHGPDVTPFYRGLLRAARDFNTASVIIDHLPKNQAGSRYTRGSGAKLQIADVAYLVDAVKPFSRQQSGLLTLTVTKDRRGYLHREHEVRVEVEDGTIALNFTTVASSGADDLSPAARKLLAVLPDASSPLPSRELVDRVVVRFGHGLKRTTVSEALNVLATRGLADGAGDPGKEKRWWKT